MTNVRRLLGPGGAITRALATALLIALIAGWPARARADKAANLATFRDAVLSQFTEDSIRPIREALPGVDLPSRSEMANFVESLYKALPETTQQRVLMKAREFGGDITKLDHYIFQEMLPTEKLLREQIAAQLPPDMFMPPKPGETQVMDKQLLVDLVARGVFALPRIQQVALLAAIQKHKGNTGMVLRIALSGLGPGYVKIGQMLGNRPGLLSPEIRAEVAKLSSEATPARYEDVIDQIEKSLANNPQAAAKRQPGKTLVETMFASIDRTPLGVGSLGQIHMATLHDGRRVVVKILKPGAAIALMRNLATMRQFVNERPNATAFKSVVDNFEEVSVAEIDYVLERHSTAEMGPVMKALDIDVPRVFPELSGSDVLVQEVAPGKPVTKAELTDAERKELAPRIFGAALYSVLIGGRFHGDLHEGNIFAGRDAAGLLRVTYIDWGMTLRITWKERIQFLRGYVASIFKSKNALMRIYGVPADQRAKAAELLKAEFAKPATAFDRLQRAMIAIQANGGSVPPNVIHAARTLMLAQGVATKLDPELRLGSIVSYLKSVGRGNVRTKRLDAKQWLATVDEHSLFGGETAHTAPHANLSITQALVHAHAKPPSAKAKRAAKAASRRVHEAKAAAKAGDGSHMLGSRQRRGARTDKGVPHVKTGSGPRPARSGASGTHR